MGDRLWERAKDVFLAVQPLSGEARRQRLEELCTHDTRLRARVLSLLDADQAPGGLLDIQESDEANLVAPDPASSAAFSEGPGSKIGPYKLLQEIGEGGFGVVYMAEQEGAIRRRVALKVVKPGMDTKQVIARFEAERQALAMMNHPNIAKVFDAGATPSGRPYFVMELVRGIPITEYCDDYRLDTRERLALFATVCNAVQHAHDAGIIHRDLKPTNVLVTHHDGTPVPKVIDFGVAKATRQRLTDSTLFTEFHQFIGTPTYMSPEQADYEGLEVDARSDVYSLGVLLYELLTGTTPFHAAVMKRAAYFEVLRILREEEPPRPSTRVSTMDGESDVHARRRRANPDALAKLLRGDLDWIVMKALEKDRRRRYDSARDMAADVQRHFEERPIRARPPSRLYALQKLVKRRRGRFAVAAVLALAFMADLGYVTWQRRQMATSVTSLQTSGLDPRGVAVLYLEAPRRGPALASVGAGLSRDLIERLERTPGIHVVSENGIRAFRDGNHGVEETALSLGVATAIAGSVEENRDDLRVTLRLLDGTTGKAVDDAVVRASPGQYLAARDEVMRAASNLISRRLNLSVSLPSATDPTESVSAWTFEQDAWQLRQDAEDVFERDGDVSASLEALGRADSLLALSEQADPNWAKAPVARAHVSYRRAWFIASYRNDLPSVGNEIRAGRAHVKRALGLAPRDAMAQEIRGTIDILAALTTEPGAQEELLTTAERDLESALAIDSLSATAHSMLSFLMLGTGDQDGAIDHARHALELDPYLRRADRLYDRVIYASYDNGQLRDADQWCDRAYALFDGNYRFAECRLWVMAAPEMDAAIDTAWMLKERIDSLAPPSLRPMKSAVAQILVAGVLRKAGRTGLADSLVTHLDYDVASADSSNLMIFDAAVRASTGDIHGALSVLRRWEDFGSGNDAATLLGSGHWWWDAILELPAFEDARAAAARRVLESVRARGLLERREDPAAVMLR